MDTHTIEQRKNELDKDQYDVCFLKGTEPPFSGKYYDHHEKGTYVCAVCRSPLFESSTKFDSGTGWPSFWDVARAGSIKQTQDTSHGMRRTEVQCSHCDAHLGHVFDDGPRQAPDGTKATGLRYCINSLSLDFVPSQGQKGKIS